MRDASEQSTMLYYIIEKGILTRRLESYCWNNVPLWICLCVGQKTFQCICRMSSSNRVQTYNVFCPIHCPEYSGPHRCLKDRNRKKKGSAVSKTSAILVHGLCQVQQLIHLNGDELQDQGKVITFFLL